MRAKGWKKATGLIIKLMTAMILAVIILPLTLYIPAVQKMVKDIAMKEVKKSTGMDIGIGQLRLRFPLKVELEDVWVIDSAAVDTMLRAGSVGLNVKVLPLLHGDIDIDGVSLSEARYQQGTPDSIFYMVASIADATLDAGSISLKKNDISVDKLTGRGINVKLVMMPDSTVTPTDTTASTPWRVTARSIDLSDVDFMMCMMPTIDTLTAHIDAAHLDNGTVDIGRRTVHASYLGVDSVSARYLYPSEAFLKAHPELAITTAADTTPTPYDQQWTVTADSLRLTGRRATYAMSGATAQPGLDMNYLEVTDIKISVDSFYNRATTIRVPIRELRGVERCGLPIAVNGTFAMDAASMRVTDMRIESGQSTVAIERASMGMGDLAADAALPLALQGSMRLTPGDVLRAYPSLRPMIGKIRGDVTLVADIHGTPSLLNIDRMSLNAAGLLRLNATGEVENVLDFDRLGGKMRLEGSMTDGGAVSRLLPVGMLPEGMLLPKRLTLNGTVDYAPGKAGGDITVTADGGRAAARGHWEARREGYDADIALEAFPVASIMPVYGVGDITATLKVKGHGYNPLKPSTTMDVALDVASAVYNGDTIGGLTLNAKAGGGHATGTLVSKAEHADLNVGFDASIARDDVAWTLDGHVADLDLRALKVTDIPCGGHLYITSSGHYNPLNGDVRGTVAIDDLSWELPTMTLATPAATLDLDASAAGITASVVNGDLRGDISTPVPISGLQAHADSVTAIIDMVMSRHRLDVPALQRALPQMAINVDMGDDNIAAQYMRENLDMSASGITLRLTNDSLLNLAASANNFVNGTTRLDTIALTATQRGRNLAYDVRVDNRPGTMDAFAHVHANGFVAENRLALYVRQRNISDETGFNVGLLATVLDSVVTARLVPRNPTIAYRQWSINENNFVSYNIPDNKIQGDINLSDGESTLHLYTTGGDTPGTPIDLIADISNVHLADWVTLSPLMPPVKGDLNANVRLRYTDKTLTGEGNVSLADFYYDRKRVGTFDADFNVATDPATNLVKANLDLAVNKVKALNFNGVLNDSTAASPLQLDFTMIKFPLDIVNPFIPDNMASVSGTLNGRMEITGEASKPVFDGYLSFDSTAVVVTMLGTPLRFSDEQIPVRNSVVHFDDFAVTAANENPLYINGTADIGDLANVGMDLNLYGHDVQVVNATKPRGADVYGKGYLDLSASLKGNTRFLVAKARVDLLSGSNVTYVLPGNDAAALTSSSTADMVHFVQFNDTTAVADADSVATAAMALIVTADINISDGTTVNVDLSADGKNKVQLVGHGALTYSLSPVNEDGRLAGRYNINSGFVRYTPPMLSEKFFNFVEGSYVSFTGDIMNPQLSIKAVDDMKANVTRQGENSRLVNFDVSVAVTGSLEAMKVTFDLSTDDDLTVSNELASMSPDQRANQAMNLLLYGIYQGGGSTGNANLSGNLLYSFLESQLNSWMANNIKGVDITFGIDQYDRTLNGNTSTATNYSYHVSKTLFNDRFKIIVGGTYSTEADPDVTLAESLINDVSAEYMLNNAGTMYIKIFRHSGYESILEGEVIQTGAGFVYKRRLRRLIDFFRPLRNTDKPATTDENK